MQSGWLEHAEGVVAGGICCNQRGSDAQRQAGAKVQSKAHTAWKSKVCRNERQADAIIILRGVVDVLASVATKDMPRTKRLNKLYYSAAKYIKQLKNVKLRHLVCTWWKGPLVAALSLSM